MKSVAAGVWLIAVVALVFLLRAASHLLIPVVLAVLASYILEPAVAWLHKGGLPRIAGAGLLLAASLALTGWGIYSLRGEAVQAVDELPALARRARELVWSQQTSGPGQRVQEAV